jgi:hypothetical protein
MLLRTIVSTFLFVGAFPSAEVAVADPLTQAPDAPAVQAAADNACPSTDFAAFLRAFSDSPDLQRRYTSFPLEFGLYHPGRDEFKKSKIPSFEKIPNYDREDRTVFPTSARIKESELKIEVITNKNSKTEKDENVFQEEIVRDTGVVAVEAHIPDTGVLVYYRFRKTKGCWYLYLISDRST